MHFDILIYISRYLLLQIGDHRPSYTPLEIAQLLQDCNEGWSLLDIFIAGLAPDDIDRSDSGDEMNHDQPYNPSQQRLHGDKSATHFEQCLHGDESASRSMKIAHLVRALLKFVNIAEVAIIVSEHEPRWNELVNEFLYTDFNEEECD